MFNCENCNKTTSSRQPENRLVFSKRNKVYENRISYGKYKHKTKVTEGWEIVKELKLCPSCYKSLSGNEPLLALDLYKRS